MALRQPVGIKVWGVVLLLYGGFASLVTLLEMIDSIRFYGLGSILIESFAAIAGFIIYGITPVFMYGTGVGLFMNRPWARKAAVSFVPALLFLFFFSQSIHVARVLTRGHYVVLELLLIRPDIFLKFLGLYLICVVPLVAYFVRPAIKDFFLSQG